jgi:cation transport ATPase
MNSTGGGRTTPRRGNLLAAVHDDKDKILLSNWQYPQDKTLMSRERALRWSLLIVAIVGLATGILAQVADQPRVAQVAWTLATIPVLFGLAASIVHDLLCGRVGVDAVALLSMATALLLGESLAGPVVALMYSGGNVLEDFAVFRAEHDLRSLVDRAPRAAHRHTDGGIAEVPVGDIAVGDNPCSGGRSHSCRWRCRCGERYGR